MSIIGKNLRNAKSIIGKFWSIIDTGLPQATLTAMWEKLRNVSTVTMVYYQLLVVTKSQNGSFTL